MNLEDSFKLGLEALNSLRSGTNIQPEALETVVLDRTIEKDRKFMRLSGEKVKSMTGEGA